MAMRALLPVVLALGLAGTAQAQNATAPAVSGPGSATSNAVNTSTANNGGAPISGANSFTESQARGRIQDKGVTQITGLTLDPQGIWRGKGMKDGQSIDVSLDYQGNITPQ